MDVLLALSLWFFAVTHVDTLVVLVAFCTDEGYHTSEVFVGHYLGFGLGLAVALVGTALAAETLQESAFLLGTVPLALGVWGMFRRRPSNPSRARTVPARRFGRVGIITMAGVGLSGENVAVFVPFFATLSPTELLVVCVVYLVAAGVTFVAAFVVARRTVAAGLPDWVDRWAVPASLTLIGLYVLSAGWLAG